MNCKSLPLICLLILLVGCEKQKYEDFVEPEPDPINIISYPDADDIDEGQNLLVNGGLEEWSFFSDNMPEHWLCHNNYNVRKDFKVVYEGHCSAKMQSLRELHAKIKTREKKIEIDAKTSFAGSLRTILRQDPNIILVGEIRDKETAEIALQAGQTGHYVLSTIHTINAIEVITRLREIGISNYDISSTLASTVSDILTSTSIFKLPSSPT